ncbi:unnamed protein product [Absidia cylindrospora]
MSHNAVSTLHSSTGAPPTPTPQPHQSSQRVSKAILKTAIQKANSAVVLDKANDLSGAIDAYTEAINLLDRVLSSETRESDRERLQETYDKYIKRIQYLGTLKSDADDLYETFENGSKLTENDTARLTKPLSTSKQQQQQQQDKGRSDTWVRKVASSSSLDSRSSRVDIDGNTSPTNITTTARLAGRSSGGSITTANANTARLQQQQQRSHTGSNFSSTTAATPTSPSSSILMPFDVPPSPVSSKSTPSKPTSNRKSNDTCTTDTMDPPPPLEPRSIHRPSPRKSSRSGAAAALQQVSYPVASSSTEQDNRSYTQQRRSSVSSMSSTSSGDSDVIRISGSHQPAMALPSLLHTKMESTSTVNNTTPITAGTDSDDLQSNNRSSSDSNENNSNSTKDGDSNNHSDNSRYGSLKLTTTSSTSTASLLSNQDETPQPSGGGFGRLRTSSLPRKLHFTRPAIGSSTRMQRLTSNASSLDMVDSSSSSSGVPMRRNVTQPSTPVTAATDVDSASVRTISGPAQRQSSGLSMRKKYNRLSRTSMDGSSGNNSNVNNNNNSSGSNSSSSNSNNNNNGGRKDKSGPIFSTLFGGSGSPYSSNSGRSTEEAMNYFGKHHHGHSQQQYSPSLDSAKHSSMDSEALSTNNGISSVSPSQQHQESGSVTMNRYLDVHLKLVIALEHSMNYGGYVTPKLFIPKNLWHQSNIRLSSMDVKVAACESLILDLNRIEKWRNLDDIRGSLRLIESLEEVVDGLQVTLSKKLKRDSLVDTNDDTSSIYSPDGSVLQSNGSQGYSSGNGGHGSHGNGSSSNGSGGTNGGGNNGSNSISGVNNNGGGSINKRTQFMSWGSKLSKSVERMNNFSLTKVEDQHRHYIEVLQKLFIKLHMLEMWFQHYLKKDRQKNPHYDVLLTKLGKVCDGINRVVGGFVLRDIAILLGKWLKRGGVWVNE